MRIRILGKYLLGNRDAILEVARSRQSVWIGLLLVISATLAREYDTHDLRSEPWRLLVPLGASLLLSGLLYVILYLRLLVVRERRPAIVQGYRVFLGLFWMTAPLAWLYAVPYERFLSDVGAAKANLWTLALVASWRVMLMSRIISVILGCAFASAFFIVMTVADPVAVWALSSMPNAFIQMMAGIQLPPRDAMILSLTCQAQMLCSVSLPFWLIAGAIAFFTMRARWQAEGTGSTPRSERGWLAFLAVAAVLFWIPFVPAAQRQQHLRCMVESDLRSGWIDEGLAMLSSHQPSDFPPHWDPPPRAVYDENIELILDVMDRVVDHPAAPWVMKLYRGKLAEALRDYRVLAWFHDDRFATSTWPRVQRLLARMDPGFLEQNADPINTLRDSLGPKPAPPPASAPATAPGA